MAAAEGFDIPVTLELQPLKYEYLVRRLAEPSEYWIRDFQELLNSEAEEGWRLAHYVDSQDLLIFERIKQGEPEPDRPA